MVTDCYIASVIDQHQKGESVPKIKQRKKEQGNSKKILMNRDKAVGLGLSKLCSNSMWQQNG